METDALWRLWKSSAVIETVKTIVYALLIVSVILTFIFRPYVIPSSSMKDTLLVGDYVLGSGKKKASSKSWLAAKMATPRGFRVLYPSPLGCT